MLKAGCTCWLTRSLRIAPWAGDEVCVSTGGYPDKRPSKNSDGSCKIHVIKSGESCGVLDKMYYLKPGDMYKFNEDNPNWVSCQDGRPWVGDRVCVSEGTPPSKDVTTNPDGSCYSHELKAGETCADMDKMYGLGPGDMYTFNENTPRWTNCQSLYEGLNVCVSKGTPAGNSVSKNKDGSCYVHTVSKGETCGSIDKLYKLNGGDNYKFNKNTYMWQGCKNNHPWVGDKICVTEGNPPKPPIDKKAECGPTAAGKEYDVKCPLNACCSQFGFCGLTSEFCKKTDSLTGAPGTAGCISNCGYGKQHTDTRSDFDKIVYWMDSDGKMASDPKELENDYDIMHYAFVNINSDFSIDDSKISTSEFLDLNIKKVASFGGWDFSTNPSTYKIFRDIASSSENRERFATNVVNFLKDYDLDGIDLDWEYPGAPDIPGIPADDTESGENYNELLKLIKSKLPSGKTLSIAIPSSYWYLKNYPIKDMQANIDYQVFMTYDIHGTWDLDKDPHVKCHTNKTEVVDALKMLDKAGVQIGKTYGGIANYGRSYKLSSSSCTGVGCLFSGGGDEGPITETAGVLALSEIDDIKSWATKGKRWTDAESQCDFMTYNGNSVVAWPKAGQRDSMEDMFHNSGLKGSVLWAGNYFKHDDYTPTFGDCEFVEVDDYDFDIVCYYGQNKDISQRRINKTFKTLNTLDSALFTQKFMRNIYYYILDNNKIQKNINDYYVGYRNVFSKISNIILKLAIDLNAEKDNKSKFYDLEEIIVAIAPTIQYRQLGIYNFALDSLNNGKNHYYGSLSTSEKNYVQEVITSADYNSGIVIGGDQEIRAGGILDYESYAIDSEDMFSMNPSPDSKWTTFNTNIHEVCGDDKKCQNMIQMTILQDGDTLKLKNLAENMLLKNIPRLPLYIVNIDNYSPGVSCNAMRYVSQYYEHIHFEPTIQMLIFTKNDTEIGRNKITKKQTCINKNDNIWNFKLNGKWEKDEFPPYSVNEGKENFNDLHTSVLCVDAADNWIDGMNLKRFFRAYGPGNAESEIGEAVIYNDWRYIIPNMPTSGSRGRVEEGDKFYVLINMHSDTDCSLYTQSIIPIPM